MNTRYDIQRELWGILAAKEKDAPNMSVKPGLDWTIADELVQASMGFDWRRHEGGVSGMRRYALEAAAAALLVVYSLDDALS